MRQLDIVLGLRPPINHDLPFAELDTLYRFILSCTKNLDLVLCILGLNDVLTCRDTGLEFTSNVIEEVLQLEAGDVCIYLSPLNSLLGLEESNDGTKHMIVFYHSSFMDFLHTPERSTDYCINAQKSGFLLVQRILQQFTYESMCLQSSVNSVLFG
jgi:hypothetical protein